MFRVGVVGGGTIAQMAELPVLAGMADVTIAGIVTLTSEGASENVRRWPIERAYDTTVAMLNDARLDALFVLTPKGSHATYVEQGLRAGVDVFCEKPLATSTRDAEALADLAGARDRILMVGFNRRYADVYRVAHDRFVQQPWGFCVAQKNRPNHEYRATLENAIHMVDLLRWFCGEAEDVEAYSRASDPYSEDGLMALIRFKGGSIASLVAARTAGEPYEQFDAYCGQQSVHVRAPDTVSITERGETRLIDWRLQESKSYRDAMGFGPEIRTFLGCVSTHRQPPTNGEEAVLTHRLVDRILESAGLPLADRP